MTKETPPSLDCVEGTRDIAALEQENARLRKYSQLLADRLEHKIQELTTANETLARTDTMKSRFINMAAHELRTPLAAVMGYVSVLISPGSKFMANTDENTLELVDGIVTSIDRLQGLVQDTTPKPEVIPKAGDKPDDNSVI